MKKIVLAFGRMNPPTIGHEKLIEECAKVARQNRCDYQIYLSNSNDKKKNPLTPQTKIKFVRKMFPKYSDHIHVDKEVSNPFKLLTKFNVEYDEVIWVAGGEDAANYDRSFHRHMESESPDFYFNSLVVHSSGERSADAEGASGMSATKMREAARDIKTTEFKSGIPDTLSTSEKLELMQEVRKGMGLE
jgi:nicotinamide mononucleotide adenylyltransferase